MRRLLSYTMWMVQILWIFRSRPAARINALHGLWLDYRGERIGQLESAGLWRTRPTPSRIGWK